MIKVLSLFDGMSCSQIALQSLGIEVDTYYASEVDKYAIEVTQINFPDTVQVGDVTKLDPKDFADVDLIVAGSPCQGFSFAGKQLNFNDPRSALFFEFVRLLKAIKPKYFLLENVRMKKEYQQVISEQVSACYPKYNDGKSLFGGLIEPILINSSLVSAQSRQRLYWTNIPNIKQPEERGIVLRDILETEPEDFTKMSNKFVARNGEKNCMIDKNKKKASNLSALEYVKNGRQGDYLACDDDGKPVDKPKKVGMHNTMGGGNREPKVVKGGAFRGRAYDKDGRRMDRDGVSVAEKTKQMLELRKDNKSNAITTVAKDSIAVNEDLTWRKLTVRECRRLQTIPEDYQMPVSNTQSYKLLGNGFTCEVIKHIFKNMEL
jgi:DNA (cytosine-5)-methyltransferase 3A